jgi:hypothetical protein
MAYDRSRRIPLLNQLLLLLMGVLVVYLMVDFGRQVALGRVKREELRGVSAQSQSALNEQEELLQQLGYAQSDQAAEAWARRMGWARQNEQPVVVVPPLVERSEDGEAAADGSLPPATQRQAWWHLFFGMR